MVRVNKKYAAAAGICVLLSVLPEKTRKTVETAFSFLGRLPGNVSKLDNISSFVKLNAKKYLAT